MQPFLHPTLVNGRFGDAALYVRRQFERAALLFDLGDLGPLSPRQLLDVGHVFVSHAHVDHFVGFDRLLRFLVGRDKEVLMWGPVGFAERVHHKLQAYEWNLAAEFRCELIFTVTEIGPGGPIRRVGFQLSEAFAPGELPVPEAGDGAILRQSGFRVHASVLDHRLPCLGFAVEETARGNVWKNRLEADGLPVGPWLRQLKQARAGRTTIQSRCRSAGCATSSPSRRGARSPT